MTVIDDRELVVDLPARRVPIRPVGARPTRLHGQRPGPSRPAVAGLRYAGHGIGLSYAAHRPTPVSTKVAVALAGLAALITIWLGSLAQLSAGASAPTQLPEQLAVVRVQAGETLQQLAERVAPESPVAQVVSRIKDLNQLGSASLEAGQTVIAPIG